MRARKGKIQERERTLSSSAMEESTKKHLDHHRDVPARYMRHGQAFEKRELIEPWVGKAVGNLQHR